MIDLRSLEAFVWIAKLGRFRAAADRLNVTQPAISTRIAALEAELGVKLFERRSRRIVPTLKGRELVGYAEQILELRGAMRRAADEQAAATGRFQMGVSDTLVHTWFPQLARRINERYPLLALDIQIDIKLNMMAALLDRKLDIAFVTEPVAGPSLITVPLVSYPLGWVASAALGLPKSPVPLARVARWPIITHLRHTRQYEAIRRMLVRDGIGDARVYNSSSIATTVTMAGDGIGVGTVPIAAVAAELRSGKLQLLKVKDAPLPAYDFVAAYLADPENHVAAAVAQLAREIASRPFARGAARQRRPPGSL